MGDLLSLCYSPANVLDHRHNLVQYHVSTSVSPARLNKCFSCCSGQQLAHDFPRTQYEAECWFVCECKAVVSDVGEEFQGSLNVPREAA